MRGVLENNPKISRERLERTRALMDAAVRDCLVTGYEGRIPTLSLPDPDDRHVLAAAVHGEADVVVTFNLADFPADVLAGHGIKPVHPDDLLRDLLDQSPAVVCAAANHQRESLKNPPRTVEEFLATLEGVGLRQTVAGLKTLAEHL